MPEELNEKEQLLSTSNFNFLSSNVKGLQSSKKRLKFFQFFKNKISPKGILFLQETHSSKVTEKIWSDEFNGDLFLSYGKTNSCGVLVGFYGNINYSVKKKLSDNSGRILVLDVTIDGTEYLLINLYNWNTEPEQLKILESLSKLLKYFQDISEKSIIFAGDFNLFFDQKLKPAGGNPILKKLAVSKLIESLNLQFPLTCVIYGKLETLNPKHLLFDNVISLEFCREDLTIYLFQAISKNRLKMLKY